MHKTDIELAKSGLLGVCATKSGERFMANIKSRGKRYYLGTFDTAEEAHAAYVDARKEMGV